MTKNKRSPRQRVWLASIKFISRMAYSAGYRRALEDLINTPSGEVQVGAGFEDWWHRRMHR